MKNEYLKELNMKYQDLCNYLHQKYGQASCDYFTTPECKTKSKKVTRTDEGLFCHHIFEDRYDNLSNPHLAKIHPFEAQKRENLVYCNYIEHLILHLKINANAQSIFENAFEINYFFDSLGFFWIAGEINDLFRRGGSSQKWRNNCFVTIKEDFEDYISVLRVALCFIDKRFTGDKRRVIHEGDELRINILDKDTKADSGALRGHQYKYKQIDTIVLKIKEHEDVIILKSKNNRFEDDELSSLKFERFWSVSPKDKSLVAYMYSILKKNYDYTYIVDGKKDEMSRLNDRSVWKELRERLDIAFSDEDIKNTTCVEKSLG